LDLYFVQKKTNFSSEYFYTSTRTRTFSAFMSETPTHAV